MSMTTIRIHTFPRTKLDWFIFPVRAFIEHFSAGNASNKYSFGVFYFASCLFKDLMLRWCKKLEVPYFIILSVLIGVMDYFIRCKISSKIFFHNKSVFSYISTIVCKGVIHFFYQNISIIIDCFTPFPPPVTFQRMTALFNMFRCMFFPSILVSRGISN